MSAKVPTRIEPDLDYRAIPLRSARLDRPAVADTESPHQSRGCGDGQAGTAGRAEQCQLSGASTATFQARYQRVLDNLVKSPRNGGVV